MKALVVGAGRAGSQVAQVLTAAGHDVTVIDIDDDRVAELADAPLGRLLAGDACEPYILEHAGALTTDILVAATGDDEDNLVVALLAKRHFAVPRVVARVNDPENAWLFDDAWGVDQPVSAGGSLVSLVVEATGLSDTVALLRLSSAGVSVIETTIVASSRSAGRMLADVPLPDATVVAAVIRGRRPIVPAGGFVLAPGDEVLLISERANEREVHTAFQ